MRATCGQKFGLIRRCLLELLSSKTAKWAQIGPEPKKRSSFFWPKSKMINIQKLKLDIQKVQMDGPIIGYVRICDDPLTTGGNSDTIWAQKMFLA